MHSGLSSCELFTSLGMRMYEKSCIDGMDCLRPCSHNSWNIDPSFPCSSETNDISDLVNYDHLIEDSFMISPRTNYDTDMQSDIMDLVPPNDVLPIATCASLSSSTDPYLGLDPFPTISNQNELIPTLPDITEDSDMPSPGVSESFAEPLVDLTKDTTLDTIMGGDCTVVQYVLGESSDSADSTSRKPYHPDYDHCYSKSSETCGRIPFQVHDSSDSSSEEVDVVTVSEDYEEPIVPKIQMFAFRNNRQRRVQKSSRARKNQTSFSAKTLNAAMKKKIHRISAINRPYRKKINNSVETTPSNSVPSSAPSSRCSSDVEDAGKRANHNSSERKRREVLRTNLQNLRLCVPTIENNPKAAKVNILNSAREYVRVLQKQDIDCFSLKQKEAHKNRLLRIKIRKLIKSIERSID